MSGFSTHTWVNYNKAQISLKNLSVLIFQGFNFFLKYLQHNCKLNRLVRYGEIWCEYIKYFKKNISNFF
jgi:hypothetical protein